MYMWHTKLSAKVTVRHRLRLSVGAPWIDSTLSYAAFDLIIRS